MTMPDVQVIFAFDEGAGGETNFFTLDDSVKGILDNTTYTLGGPFSLVDVTQYVRSVSIARGRSRLLDRTQAATASIVLDNRDRLFDPTAGTAVSPYSSSILPRKNVQINCNDEPIFSGLVDDWNIDFMQEDSTTTAACLDGFVTLGQVTLGTTTRTAQASGARVDAVLTEASWPSSKRNIDAGQVTLQADTPEADTNVLDYLQRVNDTEFGAFFMSREGKATFHDRSTVQNFTTPTLIGGTGIPFVTVSVDYGTETLYNSITLSRVNGGTAVASDSTSQTNYGVSDLSKSNLLFDDDTEMSNLAVYLLSRYKDPLLRINSVDINMLALTEAQQKEIAAIDIAAPIEITFQPTVGPAITQYASLDRVEHSITPAAHNVRLSMSRAQASFILDSSIFGELDDDRLGF
jgi:hypothetical protein